MWESRKDRLDDARSITRNIGRDGSWWCSSLLSDADRIPALDSLLLLSHMKPPRNPCGGWNSNSGGALGHIAQGCKPPLFQCARTNGHSVPSSPPFCYSTISPTQSHPVARFPFCVWVYVTGCHSKCFYFRSQCYSTLVSLPQEPGATLCCSRETGQGSSKILLLSILDWEQRPKEDTHKSSRNLRNLLYQRF